MSAKYDIGDGAYWEEQAARLRAELEATMDPERRATLLVALYRILADRLEQREESLAQIDAAAEDPAPPADILWENWRAAVSRAPADQAAALELLASAVDRQSDQVSAYLALARLQATKLEDPDAAASSLAAAADRDPDDRGVRWAVLLDALDRDDDAAAAEQLAALAEATVDPVWRAALLLELARIKRELGAPADELGELLAAALDQPGACWAIVNDVARTSEALELWELQIRALERLAAAALEAEPETPDDLPPGHLFAGFKRGAAIAAGHQWMIASVTERRLADQERALAAIQQACDLLPGAIFLELERARLLEACGRPAEALDALPDSAPTTWTAQLALVSRQPELAASVARTASSETGSTLASTLAEVASLRDEASDDTQSTPDDPWQWLIANPRHADTPARIAELIEDGTAFPLADKVRAETQEPPAPWPSEADLPEEAPWSVAIAAVDGPAKATADAYLRWSECAETPELRAALVAIAARAAEESDDAATALELCRRALELDPSQPESARQLIRLLRSNGEWTELADRMADLASDSPEPRIALTALHERALILEYQLGDQDEAVETLGQILELDEADVHATSALARLAFRAGDWEEAISMLQRLGELCPADAPRLELLCAEIELFALGRDIEAGVHLGRAAAHLNEPFADVARMLDIHAKHSLDDLPALEEALGAALKAASDQARGIWLLDLLETLRGNRGPAAAAALLDQQPTTDVALLLWRLIIAGTNRDLDGQAQVLAGLARNCDDPAVAAAARASATLLGAAGVTEAAAGGADGFPAPEALWQEADRSAADADPEVRAGLCAARAELATEHEPLEAVDWLLGQAEALEDAEDLEGALDAVTRGLELVPTHLGLLEARAYLALAAGQFTLAAETYQLLADAYVDTDEQATQLAQAAVIQLQNLEDAEAAEALAREAVSRAPSHEEAHEVLTRVLQAQGDEAALAQQIEDRIDAVLDDDALIELYQEQADRLMAVDDMEGALEAIENLLLLQPKNMSAYRTKIDLLIVNEEWEPALEAMQEFIGITENWMDKRQMVWRAADLLGKQMGDPTGAIEVLGELGQYDDHHPQTERNIAQFAEAAGDWEEVAAALARLSALVENPAKKSSILREQAQVRIERLFDPDGGAELIKRALELAAGDLQTVEMALQHRPPEEAPTTLLNAKQAIRASLDGTPVSRARISDLATVATQLEHRQTADACGLVLSILDGNMGAGGGADPVPAATPGPEELIRLLTHRDEHGSAAAKVLQISAPMSAVAFAEQGLFPEVGRATLVGKRTPDPARDWLRRWAELIGISRFDFHRAGQDPRGSIALPGGTIAVAVSPDVGTPLDAAQRFFLARHLWRAWRGFGVFQEGDTIRPVRWVLAVTATVLGTNAPLPLPTDSELVAKAADELTRKLRRQLQEPCQQLVQESPQAIKNWINASSYSADRFGLLAAGQLPAVLPALVEESAGPAGLRRLSENPEEAIGKVPRGRELLRFVLADSYLELQRAIGLADKDGQ